MEFNATFFVSALSFIIFTYVMNIILYKPIGKIINERQNFIDSAISDANDAKLRADSILKDYAERTQKSEDEARQYIADKKDEANSEAKELTTNAKQKSRNCIEQSKSELAMQSGALQTRLVNESDKLADVIVTKLLEV